MPFGILGLLTYQDNTGYDLTRIFEDSLNNFWHAQSSQIYRELRRLEESGLVTSRSIVQDGRPNKRLYSITDAGMTAFSKWLREAKPELENPHHAMLMRVFFGANDPHSVLAMLKEFRAECLRALESSCSGIRQSIENYATRMPEGEQKSKYWLMTLECGIANTQAMADWAGRCIEQIEKEMAQ